MKKKAAVIVSVILIILVLVGVSMWIASKNQNENVNPGTTQNESRETKTYLQEFETADYNARVLESDNKDYLTLYIETNLFDGTKTLSISYDSEKYILDTANPLVADIERTENEGRKSFEVELEAITRYSMNFIKRNSKNAVVVEDVTVE